MREINGDFCTPSGKIAIVSSRFNEFVVERLMQGAQDVLLRHGVKPEKIDVFKVPGAFEIPLVCQHIAKTRQYRGIIALGVVIRGETAHFDYVAGGCANGVLQAQLETGVPITFGVLTTENIEQAVARGGSTAGNKGGEAAMALLEVMSLLNKIDESVESV